MGLLNWFRRRKKKIEEFPAVAQKGKPSQIAEKPKTEVEEKRVAEKPKSQRRKRKKA